MPNEQDFFNKYRPYKLADRIYPALSESNPSS